MIRQIKIQSILVVFVLFISSNIFSQHFTSKTELEKLTELEVKGTTPYYDGSYIIELTKKGGQEKWVLPLVIGVCEAAAATRTMEKTESTRPLTYDLFMNVFAALNAKPTHIVISKLEAGTYYAIIVLQDNAGKSIEIDARPSDSINIALKANIPIYTTKEVLDAGKETR